MSRNFTDFVSAYVQYTQHQEASEKIHRWVAISIIAAALERKVFMPRGYYTLFPNLYMFIIGASGVVRKSTSTSIGVDMLRSLDNFNMMSERVTAASLIQQLERSGSKYMMGSREMLQSATFCYASELQVFLNEVFGSISELLTTFYDCQPNDHTKPWVYETKGQGQIKIYGPCLNILGASTPTWLTRAIPASEMEGGFSSRVIFVVENAPPSRFVAWPELHANAVLERSQLIDDLRRIHALVGQFTVADAARIWYDAWYRDHQTSLVTAQRDMRFAGYFGRKGDMVLKIAMILCVSESDNLRIETAHLERAVAYLDDLESTMFEAFGATGKNETATDLHQVWEVLRRRSTTTHSQLMRSFWRNLDHRRLMNICEDLRRMNFIAASVDGQEIVYRTLDSNLRL